MSSEYKTSIKDRFVIDCESVKINIVKFELYSPMVVLHCFNKLMPPLYIDSCYRVKDGVETICDCSIANSFIETLILPEGCKVIEEYGITGSDNLKSVFLPKSIKVIGLKNFIFAPLTDIYYGGNERDREQIYNQFGEKMLLDEAIWHYNVQI